MIDEGFIKIHRKILKWEWYQVTNVMCVFLHCLILANHKSKKWQGMTIERGQFISSYAKLAQGVNLSVQQIRTALNKLKSTSEITVETTNRFTMITVTNYSTYHDHEKESNKQNNNQITNEQQTDNNQITTTKNVKNVKNVKKKKEEKELVFPEWLDQKLFSDFVEMRVEIKKPMTRRAKELMIMKIVRFKEAGQDIKAVIEKSIVSNWSDIYEQKGDGNGKNTKGRKQEPVKKAGSKSEREERRPTTYTFED